jgi:hypothetical protein
MVLSNRLCSVLSHLFTALWLKSVLRLLWSVWAVENTVLTDASWFRRHFAASNCAFESTVLSSGSPMFPSESLHCFELGFAQLHRRCKAPYANLVYIYICRIGGSGGFFQKLGQVYDQSSWAMGGEHGGRGVFSGPAGPTCNSWERHQVTNFVSRKRRNTMGIWNDPSPLLMYIDLYGFTCIYFDFQ